MPGHCDNCEEDRLAKIRHGEKLMQESMRKGKSEAPDLEMPETSPELAEQLGFPDQERDDDDGPDEYWK